MKKNRITFKIFCITSGLLVMSAIIMYLTLYFLLPNFYYEYKKDTLEKGVTSLVERLEDEPFEKIELYFNEFVETYNVRLFVQNQFGYVAYFPLTEFTREDLGKGRMHFPGRNPLNRRFLDERLNNSNVIIISSPISFQGSNEKFLLTVSAPLQPIDEASKVLILFLPYMLFIIAIISIIGAYFYSNLLAKPLLQLNNTAKKMAKLDFTTNSSIQTNDELGELSKSLNSLSMNLQKNINELKEANTKLKDDIQKEREQEQKRREFIATISHELKTPITAVSGQLEGMIFKIGSYKDRDKYLKQSYSILNDMEKLVHEILDVSQLESSYFTPKLTNFNLSNLVEDEIHRAVYFYEEKEIIFKNEIEPNIFIEGDEKLIKKAFANVLSNALKYTPPSGKINVQLNSGNIDAELIVFNSGSLILEDEIEKIFEPFYRIEKSRNRKTGGSGLGLYIVKKILELHHVTYFIENKNDGVQFTMRFQK